MVLLVCLWPLEGGLPLKSDADPDLSLNEERHAPPPNNYTRGLFLKRVVFGVSQ